METFSELCKSLPHWEFEFLISIIFMLIEGLVFWPLARLILKHHRTDDSDIAELRLEVSKLKSRMRELENDIE